MKVLSMLRIYLNMSHCTHKGGSCKHFDKGGTIKSQTISPLKMKCKSVKHDTEGEGGTNGCIYCCNICSAKRIYTKKGATYKGWPKRFGTRNKVVDGKVTCTSLRTDWWRSYQRSSPLPPLSRSCES